MPQKLPLFAQPEIVRLVGSIKIHPSVKPTPSALGFKIKLAFAVAGKSMCAMPDRAFTVFSKPMFQVESLTE